MKNVCYTDYVRACSTQSGNIDESVVSGVSADTFKSGEIAYKLNGDQTNIVWKQTIGEADYPSFTGEQVYSVAAGLYANDTLIGGICGAEGTNGDNLKWVIDKEGTLIITGTGAMADWNNMSDIPWFEYKNEIVGVEIRDGVTSIGKNAFNALKLSAVTIPASVTSIGENPFNGCESLMMINVNENNKIYSAENGVLFNKDKTTLTLYPSGKAEQNYMVPEDVTAIADNAFNSCTALESVTEIADNAFVGWKEGFAIRGFANSAAQTYAEKKGIAFIALSRQPVPEIEIDCMNEELTGFADGAEYTINGEEITPVDGRLDMEAYIGKIVSVVRKGDGEATLDSPEQVFF